MSKIYCGVGKIPKGYKMGTMKECAEKGQIRYYGLKKIDTKIVEASKNKKSVTTSRDKLVKAYIKLDGRIKRLNDIIKYGKDETKVKEAKKELKKTETEQLKIKKEIDAIKKDSSTGSVKGSKKGTKKETKKVTKKGSKKGSKKGTKKETKKGTKK